MRNYVNEHLFHEDSIDKQLIIKTSSGIVIDNTLLNAEEFSLEDSICSEQELTYGACESACVKFRVSNIIDTIINEELTISMVLNGDTRNPIQIGKYTVDSDKPTANRDWRDITAYDKMKYILEADVTDWYSTCFPKDTTTRTIKYVRDSFFNYLGIQQDPDVSLVNDYIVVAKTLNIVSESGETTMKEGISGKDVITRLCEINACFGHIDYLGRFTYIYLTENTGALYPADDLYPSDDLYPKQPAGENVSAGYRDLQYEDYYCEKVTRIIIRESENDIGYILNNDTTNTYTITGNFFLYGKSSEQLKEIATNIFNAISFVSYKPIDATIRGNFCIELGDLLRLHTDKDIIFTYLLERKISGIQSLKDNISSKGTQYIIENNNSLSYNIIQIKGKANKLERSIEETKLTIVDVETGLQSQITQNASSITAEVTRATKAEGELSSKISLTDTAITAEVTRAKSAEGTLSASITATAKNICLQVKSDTESSQFSVKNNAITIYSGSITLDASSTNSGNVIIKSGTLGSDGCFYVNPTNDLTATIGGTQRNNLRFILGSKFGIGSKGQLYCSEAYISGTISATSGNIGAWTIQPKTYTAARPEFNTNGALSFGTPGYASSALLSPYGYTVTSTDSAVFGGTKSGSHTWVQTIGQNFAVDNTGKLYCSGGKIGEWSITSTGLSYGEHSYSAYLGKSDITCGVPGEGTFIGLRANGNNGTTDKTRGYIWISRNTSKANDDVESKVGICIMTENIYRRRQMSDGNYHWEKLSNYIWESASNPT